MITGQLIQLIFNKLQLSHTNRRRCASRL